MPKSTSALDLSDADFMNADPASFVEDDSSTDTVQEEAQEDDTSSNTEDPIDTSSEDESSTEDEDQEDQTSEAQEQTSEEEEEDEIGQPEGDTQQEHEKSDSESEEESHDTNDSSTDTKGDTPDNSKIDYKSAFEEITKPFKANGSEMQVTNPQDIVRLMQMGANYNKKMAQLKPNLQLVKMLEKADLLDVSKLNNLIDISKKDPAAISKLIKDSGIDPLDMDTDGADNYRPRDHSISEKEYALDEALDSIKDTATFDKTIDVLTKEWDSQSRNQVSDNPEIIGVINTHLENGVFDKVKPVLDRERTLGNLKGVSDVDAYYHIATKMAEEGLLVPNKPQPSNTVAEPSKVSRGKQQKETERKNSRKAAAPNKSTRTPASDSEGKEFLGLSDDDFMKKYGVR